MKFSQLQLVSEVECECWLVFGFCMKRKSFIFIQILFSSRKILLIKKFRPDQGKSPRSRKIFLIKKNPLRARKKQKGKTIIFLKKSLCIENFLLSIAPSLFANHRHLLLLLKSKQLALAAVYCTLLAKCVYVTNQVNFDCTHCSVSNLRLLFKRNKQSKYCP